MIPAISIFERIGLGGGGKVKAVYHRMNALAEMPDIDPILLNLNHSPRQKLNFKELQAKGTLAARLRHVTLPEACHQAALAAGIQPFDGFPAIEHSEKSGLRTLHFNKGQLVMIDRVRQTSIGTLTLRTLPHKDGDQVFSLIDGAVHQMVQRKPDGTTETTDFVQSLPVRWLKTQGQSFVIGKNLITGKICRMPRIYDQNIFDMIGMPEAVVFFDGITSAYLSPVTKGKRALFLHADHRGPNGEIVPRSKFLIENFQGEAIITSTIAHKTQMLADVKPAAAIHVIPHYCKAGRAAVGQRKNLVTVSRLELDGKPIHECIEAFCRIMHAFPDVDYLIYGVGGGHKRLISQIEQLGCGNRVRLMGYTSTPLAIFQDALASVYPTTTEGFGLSILEALSNGCPVISYDVNYGPREMVVSGQNGELVAPADIAAIAVAMQKVLSNPAFYQANTQQGLHRYSREAYLANYHNFVAVLSQKQPIAENSH